MIWSFVFVAEHDVSKQIVGFANGGQERSNDPGYTGELWAIYLPECHRGKGIGQRLALTLVKKFVEEGHDPMLVWCLRTILIVDSTRNLVESIYVQNKLKSADLATRKLRMCGEI